VATRSDFQDGLPASQCTGHHAPRLGEGEARDGGTDSPARAEGEADAGVGGDDDAGRAADPETVRRAGDVGRAQPQVGPHALHRRPAPQTGGPQVAPDGADGEETVHFLQSGVPEDLADADLPGGDLQGEVAVDFADRQRADLAQEAIPGDRADRQGAGDPPDPQVAPHCRQGQAGRARACEVRIGAQGQEDRLPLPAEGEGVRAVAQGDGQARLIRPLDGEVAQAFLHNDSGRKSGLYGLRPHCSSLPFSPVWRTCQDCGEAGAG
jgi:hypothetical protein